MKFEDFIKDNKPKLGKIIYQIIKTKEKQDCVYIYLDNKEKICLSVESYFNYGVSSIKGLDENLYNKLKEEERILLGYNACLRKLSCKDYSCKQIKEYLYVKKELHKNEVESIINKLYQYNLLDDDKYAYNRVTYLNKQLYSNKQIKNKLVNEGISQDLIDKYVVSDYETELNKVEKLVNKYSNTIKNKSTLAMKQSILMKLTGLGYSYDICKEVIDKTYLKNDNEFDLLNKEYNKIKLKYSKKYTDYDLRSHIYAYLLNKGFKSEDIKKVIGDLL